MRISRVFYSGPLEIGLDVNLPSETSHYITHVLRLKLEANISLFNGDGQEYLATIIGIQKKSVIVKLKEVYRPNNESPIKIHLAQGISRGEKMDWTIQKAVELGVTKITPLITEYCSIKLKEDRIQKRLNHWQKIIISACEQSGRTMIPELCPVFNFKDWITHADAKLKLFCDPMAEHYINSTYQSDEVLILIGPEGGLSKIELDLALQHNFLDISLGPRILRTETAGLVAIAILQNCIGDMGHFVR